MAGNKIRNKKGLARIWIISLIVLVMILLFVLSYFLAQGIGLFSLGGSSVKVDCSNVTNHDACCKQNDYGYWSGADNQCISDVESEVEDFAGGGQK